MTIRNALCMALIGLPLAVAAAPAPITLINGATVIHPSRNGDAVVEPGATMVISGDKIQLADIGNLPKVHRAIKDGVVHDPEELMRSLR